MVNAERYTSAGNINAADNPMPVALNGLGHRGQGFR